jgi:hypothetical protein
MFGFVPNIWLAKTLVELLVSHELAKNHWHTKNLATIQTTSSFFVIAKNLAR